MKNKKLLSFMAVIAIGTSQMIAADYYVAANGNDANPGTEAQPFGSPEMAFLSLIPGEPTTIHLQKDATFTVGSIRLEDDCIVKLVGDNSTLKAAATPGREGGEGSRILRIGKGAEAEISGVNFVNGRQVGYFAGGAIFDLGKKLIIDNCSFVNNEAGSAGGAVASRGHYVKITNSFFDGNYTIGGGSTGGAINMVGNADAENFGELHVENCAFVNTEITEGGGHATVIGIYDPCEDVCYSLTGKLSVINCTFLNSKNVQAYQADIDIADNGDCEFLMVNNTIVGSDCGLRLFFQDAPCYMFNNFIYANKAGITTELSIAESDREGITAVNNVIIGGEQAVNEYVDDPMLNGNGNTLGLAKDNSLASFGMAATVTRDGNIGYMAIGQTSKLIDKGLDDSSEYTGTNRIPATDCRGVANGKKDIGAYEYGNNNGVSAIVTNDANAPVVYYNLQGVQVAEPANGLFIERRGNSVRKVIIK